jgi:hypothetical protein
MKEGLVRLIDQQLAKRSAANAAQRGLEPKPDRFLLRHTGSLPVELPPGPDLEQVVNVQEEEKVRATIRSYEEELTVYANPYIYLGGVLLLTVIDTVSSTSVMLELGYNELIAALQGLMLSCTLIACIAGVLE